MRRHVGRGLPAGDSGAVTIIQRANSDLRLNPHLHTAFLDDVYSPDGDNKGQMFHPATTPTQQEHPAPAPRQRPPPDPRRRKREAGVQEAVARSIPPHRQPASAPGCRDE
jgi:hypothetical protein